MNRTAQPASSPGTSALWTGVLGGPLLWFADQQTSYLLVRWACAHDRLWVLHAVAALFLLLALAVLALAVRSRRRIRESGHDLLETTPHRRTFLATLGVALSALFTVAIAVQAIPNLLLDPCHR